MLQREEIYQQVWGYAMAHGDRSVDVFIRKVRQKLEGASPDWSTSTPTSASATASTRSARGELAEAMCRRAAMPPEPDAGGGRQSRHPGQEGAAVREAVRARATAASTPRPGAAAAPFASAGGRGGPVGIRADDRRHAVVDQAERRSARPRRPLAAARRHRAERWSASRSRNSRRRVRRIRPREPRRAALPGARSRPPKPRSRSSVVAAWKSSPIRSDGASTSSHRAPGGPGRSRRALAATGARPCRGRARHRSGRRWECARRQSLPEALGPAPRERARRAKSSRTCGVATIVAVPSSTAIRASSRLSPSVAGPSSGPGGGGSAGRTPPSAVGDIHATLRIGRFAGIRVTSS